MKAASCCHVAESSLLILRDRRVGGAEPVAADDWFFWDGRPPSCFSISRSNSPTRRSARGLPHAQRELTLAGDPFTRGVNVRRVGRDPIRGTRGLRCRGASGFVSGVFKAPAHWWPAEIRVLSPLGAEGERRVLLHEMCHAAVWFAGHHGGPRFIAELERLASLGEGMGSGRGGAGVKRTLLGTWTSPSGNSVDVFVISRGALRELAFEWDRFPLRADDEA